MNNIFKIWLLTFVTSRVCLVSVAQTVSNVTVMQVEKTIHVSYDLDEPADVTLFLSTDGGLNYTELHQVRGHVGVNVPAGHKTIVWNVLDEMASLRGDNIVFKVKAEPVSTYATVTTDTVTNIQLTSAMVGGTVAADGGATVTSRGICWSTTPNPGMSGYYSREGSGTGSYNSYLSDLKPNTTYYVRAYATNSMGTAFGKQQSFTTKKEASNLVSSYAVDSDLKPTTTSNSSCGIVKDYDGNTYKTVQIGKQCWMAENLRTTHYGDGVLIALGSTSVSSSKALRYYPGNSARNLQQYGYLYNWKAVMRNSLSANSIPSGVRGICPEGWHVPSRNEWIMFINYISSQDKYRCGGNKENVAKSLASSSGWVSSNEACAVGNDLLENNRTKFSLVPAGCYSRVGTNSSTSYVIGRSAFLWFCTEYDSYGAWNGTLYSYEAREGRWENLSDKSCAFSVRCLKD